jgi:hypothetical protein
MMFHLSEERPSKLPLLLNAVGILAAPVLISLLIGMGVSVLSQGRINNFDLVWLAPTYFLPVVLGGILGYFVKLQKHPPSTILYFVWILPMTLALLDYVWPGSTPPQEIFRKQFMRGYEYDEGLSQVLVIGPMMGALSYAIVRKIFVCKKQKPITQ